jgi:hypothetical protein
MGGKMKIGIYTDSWNFGEVDAQTLAKTFDMSQSWCSPDWPQHPEWDYTTKANQVHALNPNYRFLVYRNLLSIYNYWADEWNYANQQGWLLKNAAGQYCRAPNWSANYMVDIGNPNYQAWVANIVKTWLTEYPFFDGVMADNSLIQTAGSFNWYSSVGPPINPRTGKSFTDQDVVNACIGMLNTVIDAIGTAKILLANGFWTGFVFADPVAGANYRSILSGIPRLNAIFSEGCFLNLSAQGENIYYSETDWKSSLDMLIWMNNRVGSRGYVNIGGYVIANPDATFPANTTREQMALFNFCSMLLGSASGVNNSVTFGSVANMTAYGLTTLAQTLRQIDLGDPYGNYYKVAGTSIYARDFASGMVLVNPTYNSYSISLGATYIDLNGKPVTSVVVGPHTGIILFSQAIKIEFNFPTFYEENKIINLTLTLKKSGGYTKW